MSNPNVRTSALTPQYGWNETSNRYVDLSTGRFVSGQAVRDALDVVAEASRVNINKIATQMFDGELTLKEFRDAMRAEIKTLHVVSAATAKGGWAQMTPADWGFVGSQVKAQYEYLEGFCKDIKSGQYGNPLNGSFLVRANLYAGAGRGTYEDMKRRMFEAQGLTLERRVLGAADHCPTCLSEAAKRWQPIGTLNRIGDSECVTNCRCQFQFKQKANSKAVFS